MLLFCFIDEHLSELRIGIRFGSLYDEVRLARNRVVSAHHTSMSIALREALQRHTAHQEVGKHTICDIHHSLRLHTLVIILVETIECIVVEILQGRVAIHAEGLRQYLLSYHLLESLSTRLHAVSLQTMTEDFMEEHTTGRTRKDGRTRIRIGDRSRAQCLQSLHEIFGISYHLFLCREFVQIVSQVVEIERAGHSVRSHHRSRQHHACHTSVLHHLCSVCIDEIVSINLKLDRSRTALYISIVFENIGNLVESCLPKLRIYLFLVFRQVFLVVDFGRSLREARRLVLIILSGKCLGLSLFQVVERNIITSEHLFPDSLSHGRNHLSAHRNQCALTIA